MKSQPTVNFSHFGQLLSSILLILLVSLFVAGDAQACHKSDKPHGKGAPETCGQTGVVAPDNAVLWGIIESTSGIFEKGARVCTVGQIATDESSGDYSCVLDTHIEGVRTTYNFAGMTSEPIHKRGDDWYCQTADLTTNVPMGVRKVDLEYSFSWAGNCTGSDGCNVTIVNRLNNPWSSGGSVSRVTLEAFAKATESSKNPFSEPQSLNIDYLHLTLFAAKGRDKVLAVCKLTPHVDHPVTFVTVLAE